MIYFISIDRLKKITGVADAMSDERIRSSIYMAQVNHIIPILGFETYSYISQLISAGLVQDGSYEQELIESYLQPILAWHTLGLAAITANTVTDIAVGHLADISPEANPFRVRNFYKGLGNAYITRANDWLCKVTFPYYETNKLGDKGNFQGINVD